MHDQPTGASIIPLADARGRRTSRTSMHGPEERLLKKREMAADLRVSTRTLDRWAQESLIPFEVIRVSHTGATARRYRRSAVRGALGIGDIGDAPLVTVARKRELRADPAPRIRREPASRAEFDDFRREVGDALAQIQVALDGLGGAR